MSRGQRMRRPGLIAVALAAAVTLGAGMGLPGGAWGANLDNPDVPTDDTGVVAPTQDEGAQKSDGAETDAEGEAPNRVAPQKGQTLTPPAEESEGLGLGPSEDDSAAASQAPAFVTDPVFGTERNPDNLVNPQQKPDSSFIYDTSISALQEADAYLNDQTVQVVGEVVGDRLKAEFDPGYCWIVLQSNEENYAEIPVFITEELTELVDLYGSYGRKGTTLQTRGTFHLACPEHEGLTDLHADTVSVVEKGSITEQVLNPSSFIPGGILVLVGGLMVIVFHRMREGQR